MYIQATELSGGVMLPQEDVQLTIAIRDLLIKLLSLWNESDTTQNELRPVRAIVQAAVLDSADFDYLEAYAPGMTFALPDQQKVVDSSRLRDLRLLELARVGSSDISVLRAWHIVLLRSTFWDTYHRTYDPIGTLASVSEHANDLWRMLDPLYDGSTPPRLTHNISLRNAVVYRQILANRSELSDRHPLDALARVCIPGYVERVQLYIEQHQAQIDAMMGLTV